MKIYTFKPGMLRGRLPQKILLIMRLVIIIMVTCLMQVSAAGFAQRLTYAKRNTTIAQVFTEIKKQTGYNVLYSDQKVDGRRKLNVNFQNTALEEVLDVLLKGQPLAYEIDQKTILIKVKKSSILDKVAGYFANIDVRGRVVDNETGEGLPGATVKVKSGSLSASTDKDGNFFLSDVSEDAVLEISYIGYLVKTVMAGRDVGTIRLELATSNLEEVTINKGYYRESKRLSTGNIGRVTAKDIQNQPVSNPIAALQGRISGVEITQQTGVPGGNFKVRIRGTNSIANGNDPLYIIDGVPFISNSMSFLETSGNILGNPNPTAAQGSSPLNSINPSDIESMEVLKDADATAIYGSRGSNGIVLITTKKGKIGKTKVDFNFYSGIGDVANKVNMINTRQYLDMRYEAYRNEGTDYKNPSVIAPDLKVLDTTRFTNWQEELIGGTANYRDLQINLSGGEGNTQFSLGGGQHRETTVFPGDNADRRTSIHASINNSSWKDKLKTSLSINYGVNSTDMISRDLTLKAFALTPIAPELYDESGNISWKNWSSSFENPLAYLKRKYDATTNNLIGNALISYAVMRNLEVRTSFGYTKANMKAISTTPLSSIDPAIISSSQNESAFSNSEFQNWIVEPQINWRPRLGKGSFEILIGSTFLEQNNEGLAQFARGFSSESLMKNISSASIIENSSNRFSQYRYNAVYGRINYTLNQKYVVNITGRRDGSSRFGPGKQFANFAALGAVWLFSEENFFKTILPFVSFGKLKTSFGTSGNDQLEDYQYLDAYTSSNSFQGSVGLAPIRLSNPKYAWETNKKMEAAIELGLLKDRILFNVAYYRNRSSNQLVGYPLAPTTGFATIQGNFPATVQNRGVEFEVTTTNIATAAFSWSTSFNASAPRNKLLAFPDMDNFPAYANKYVVGEPLSIGKYYRFTGLNETTGLYEFEDVDANGSFDFRDRQSIKFIGQQYSGGLQNSLKYKGFDLDFLFQFVKQTGYNPTFEAAGSASPQQVSVLERWTKPGDNGPIQRYGTKAPSTTAASRYNQSDQTIGDASFIRLKNVALSYSLPQGILDNLNIINIRIFVQSQNLLTITNYKGLDPESGNSTYLPPLRVITAGAQLTF